VEDLYLLEDRRTHDKEQIVLNGKSP